MKILVMGLNGSGKTTLSEHLSKALECPHLNADEVRREAEDWDFSYPGRIRQALRMSWLASKYDMAVCDFICPTEELRTLFGPDRVIFMDTVDKGEYEDTNSLFEPPVDPDIIVTDFDYDVGDIILRL